MKKVMFKCPHHGALNNPIEYTSIQIGTFLYTNVCLMFCPECNAYYTPYTNLLKIATFCYKGKTVRGSMQTPDKSIPHHSVLPLTHARIIDSFIQATRSQQSRSHVTKTISHNRPKQIRGYEICGLINLNQSAFKQIFLTNYDLKNICFCGNNLINYANFLPIDNFKAIKVPGKFCTRCNHFFETNGFKLKKLCDEISIDSTSYLDLQYIIPDYEERLNLIRGIPSIAIAIHLKEIDSSHHRIIAIVKSRPEEKPLDDIFHYSNRKALLLLSSLYRKDSIIHFDEKEYTIRSIQFKNATGVDNLLIDEIVLRKGGGLYHGIHQKHIELFDILLYSPFNNCLEIAHASYDILKRIYYMDPAVFRAFVKKYGNPGIKLVAYQSGEKDLYTMNDESLLHAYGYVVGNNGLGDCERHMLLAEVLDLELMSAHSVIYLLKHNISMHSNEMYKQARNDWELDKEFVMGYKVNPDRFRVASIGLIG